MTGWGVEGEGNLAAKARHGVCSRPVSCAPALGKPLHSTLLATGPALHAQRLPRAWGITVSQARCRFGSEMALLHRVSVSRRHPVTAKGRARRLPRGTDRNTSARGRLKKRIYNNCAAQIPIQTQAVVLAGRRSPPLVCWAAQGEKPQETELAGSHRLEGHVPSSSPLSAPR